MKGVGYSTFPGRPGLSRVRGGGGDSEAVYLVRGSVLSLSFVEPTNETDQGNQMNQIPATRREMVPGSVSLP